MNAFQYVFLVVAFYVVILFGAGGLIAFVYLLAMSKTIKRVLSPCKECRFNPSKVTKQDPADGNWHQIQECERCGRKRDAVLSQSTLEAARKFFIGQQP